MTARGRPPVGKGKRHLTVSQKAEAAALWRSGEYTLEELSKKFGKTPEALSRLFKRMGAVKGEAAKEAAKKRDEMLEAKMLADAEETMRRILKTREDHYKMSQAIAYMAFKELQQAKAAELDVARLKDVMVVYKMVGEIVGNSRREIFDILNVEKHDQLQENDQLPDLTVRELTGEELKALRGQLANDTLDIGASMLDLEDDDD